MGICLPRRHDHRVFLRRRQGQAGRIRLVRDEQRFSSTRRSARRSPIPGGCMTFAAMWWNGCSTSTTLTTTNNAPAMAASLIRGIRPPSPTRTRAGRFVGRRSRDVPQRRPPRLGPVLEDADPQLPKSVWYFSDAQFVGFRIRASAQSAAAGTDAKVLDQRRGKRLNFRVPARRHHEHRLSPVT